MDRPYKPTEHERTCSGIACGESDTREYSLFSPSWNAKLGDKNGALQNQHYLAHKRIISVAVIIADPMWGEQGNMYCITTAAPTML